MEDFKESLTKHLLWRLDLRCCLRNEGYARYHPDVEAFAPALYALELKDHTIKQLHDVFCQIDADGGGTLDMDEVRSRVHATQRNAHLFAGCRRSLLATALTHRPPPCASHLTASSSASSSSRL